MDPNNIFGTLKFNDLILWLLSLATLFSILESIGLFPNSLAKWLARNRLENTLNSLKKLNVRVCWDEEKGLVTINDRMLDTLGIREHAYKQDLKRLLKEDSYRGAMEIGGTTTFSSDVFIDVMGSTTEPKRALRYAKILHTHLKIQGLPIFDLVATPRTGSPILGYEFARLCHKPFIMGVHEKLHDKGQTMGHHATLDFPSTLNLSGMTVLIIDDSTTGGRKQVELAVKLRSAGAIVNSSLILFEPIGKGARDKLKGVDITLYSVMNGPIGNY